MSHSITLRRDQLQILLKTTLPHAGTDQLLPVLNSIELRVRDGHVQATATDKFTLAVCTQVLDDQAQQDGDFRVLIPTEGVKTLLTLFKATGREGLLPITLTVDEGDNWLQARSGVTTTIELRDAVGWPRLNGIITSALDDEACSVGWSVNPKLLERINKSAAAAGLRGEGVHIRHGSKDSKPSLVVAGEHLLMLVMPRKLVDGTMEGLLDPWRESFGVARTKVGAA